MADTKILLIGNPDSETLVSVLGRAGRSLVRVDDPAKLSSVGTDHDVIVIGTVAAPKTVADVCRDVRAVAELADVPILAISPADEVEERIRLLEAGADDVMIRPLDERELDARVDALNLRRKRGNDVRPSTVVAPTQRPGRRLIAVYSPKGGVGTTTVAVNLALAITVREPERVALVDLTPMGGQVATQLDLRPKMTIADLVRESHGSISADLLRKAYLTRHERGVFVLGGAAAPSATPLMSGPEASRILDAVIAAMPTVVVDLGSHLDDRVMAAIDAADDLVVVVTPDFPALQAVHQFLEFLSESGKSTEPTIVVNELYALQTLTPSDVENALGRRVTVRLPYDPLLYLRAVNQGTPVIVYSPTSQPARRFEQLAAVLVGDDAPPPTSETRRRGLSGIFGRS